MPTPMKIPHHDFDVSASVQIDSSDMSRAAQRQPGLSAWGASSLGSFAKAQIVPHYDEPSLAAGRLCLRCEGRRVWALWQIGDVHWGGCVADISSHAQVSQNTLQDLLHIVFSQQAFWLLSPRLLHVSAFLVVLCQCSRDGKPSYILDCGAEKGASRRLKFWMEAE